VEEAGPGLSSISPARSKRKKKRIFKYRYLVFLKLKRILDNFMKKPDDTLSKHLQTDEKGNGW